jgi:hypothetical protein
VPEERAEILGFWAIRKFYNDQRQRPFQKPEILAFYRRLCLLKTTLGDGGQKIRRN